MRKPCFTHTIREAPERWRRNLITPDIQESDNRENGWLMKSVPVINAERQQ